MNHFSSINNLLKSTHNSRKISNEELNYKKNYTNKIKPKDKYKMINISNKTLLKLTNKPNRYLLMYKKKVQQLNKC